MKITFIDFVIYCFMLLSSLAMAAVTENNINPNAEKLVLNTSVQYWDSYYPQLSASDSAIALTAGMNGEVVSMHESVWLQTTYSAAHTQFKLSQTELALDDAFSRYNVGLLSRFFMGDKWYLDLEGAHAHVDYLLGTGIAKLRPTTLMGDSVDSNNIAASIVYGGGGNNSDSRASRRFIKFTLSHIDQDYADKNSYSNLFDLTRDKAELGLSFKLSEVTQFESSFEFEKVDFVDDSQLDNDVYRLLLGFNWQGTGQTHLSLLVGGYQRVYQSSPDNQGVLAELDAEYKPFDNLSITVNGSQTTTSGVVEDALDTIVKSANVAINYAYKEHINFIVKMNTSSTWYENIDEDQTSTQSAAGFVSSLSVYDHSAVSLILQRESLKYDFLDLDYVQNKVELNCRYAF